MRWYIQRLGDKSSAIPTPRIAEPYAKTWHPHGFVYEHIHDFIEALRIQHSIHLSAVHVCRIHDLTNGETSHCPWIDGAPAVRRDANSSAGPNTPRYGVAACYSESRMGGGGDRCAHSKLAPHSILLTFRCTALPRS